MSALTTSIILEVLASAIKQGNKIKCIKKVKMKKIKVLSLEDSMMVYIKKHWGIYKENKHLELINGFSQFIDYEVNVQKSTLYNSYE